MNWIALGTVVTLTGARNPVQSCNVNVNASGLVVRRAVYLLIM